jgi:hypothetical protein
MLHPMPSDSVGIVGSRRIDDVLKEDATPRLEGRENNVGSTLPQFEDKCHWVLSQDIRTRL